MSANQVQFEANALYILLSDIGAPTQFHWLFYLATTSSNGRIYHMVNNLKSGGKWKYDPHDCVGVPYSKTVLVVLKIADMDPVLHAPLGAALEAVSDDPPVTCRIWLKRALQDLDDSGFIQLIGDVDDIEMDAEERAVQNELSGMTTVEMCSFIKV